MNKRYFSLIIIFLLYLQNANAQDHCFITVDSKDEYSNKLQFLSYVFESKRDISKDEVEKYLIEVLDYWEVSTNQNSVKIHKYKSYDDAWKERNAIEIRVDEKSGLEYRVNYINFEVKIHDERLYPVCDNCFLDYSEKTYQEKELSSSDFDKIVMALSAHIIVSSSGKFYRHRFQNIILAGLNLPLNIEKTEKHRVISNFLNNNKQKLICRESAAKANDRDLHIYKTAALEGIIDLFDEILLNDDEFDIDFNAYEIVNGKKETIIDYLDMMIASNKYDNDELTLLRDDILEMGGKRGSEL